MLHTFSSVCTDLPVIIISGKHQYQKLPTDDTSEPETDRENLPSNPSVTDQSNNPSVVV